jgi:hypothetical protein
MAHKIEFHFLKHAVAVRGVFWNFLNHIPVLNNLSVFNAENIHNRPPAIFLIRL